MLLAHLKCTCREERPFGRQEFALSFGCELRRIAAAPRTLSSGHSTSRFAKCQGIFFTPPFRTFQKHLQKRLGWRIAMDCRCPIYGQSQKEHKATNWSDCLVQIWGNGRCGAGARCSRFRCAELAVRSWRWNFFPVSLWQTWKALWFCAGAVKNAPFGAADSSCPCYGRH